MTAPQIGSTTAATSSGGTAKVTVSEGTDYVVLEQVARPEHIAWAEFARETARDAQSAIILALSGNKDGGTFIAIAARSFKPYTVTPQTVTTLKLEEAK